MKKLERLRAKVKAQIEDEEKRRAEEQARAEGVLTHAKLKELLHYDPDTGHFTRLVGKNKGERAGYQNINGYVYVYVEGQEYGAHRLAWYYTHGSWPSGDIDHKDRDKTNNKLENLRDVDRATNLFNRGLQKNNKTGVRNVHYDERREKWIVYRSESDKRIYVGAYDTLEEAATEAAKYTPEVV